MYDDEGMKKSEYWKAFWKDFWRKKYPPDLIDKIDKARLIQRCSAFARHHRDKIMFRDGYKCRECKSDKNLVLHHTKYVNDFDHILTLCQNCHDKLHKKRVARDIKLEPLHRKRLLKWNELHKDTDTKLDKDYRNHLIKRGTIYPTYKRDDKIRTPSKLFSAKEIADMSNHVPQESLQRIDKHIPKDTKGFLKYLDEARK